MDQAEFRQTAMIAAMQGLLAASDGWCGDNDAKELVRRSILFADALLEANTIDEIDEKES
jgi:hypothetical protein